jgi:hypothetical protein
LKVRVPLLPIFLDFCFFGILLSVIISVPTRGDRALLGSNPSTEVGERRHLPELLGEGNQPQDDALKQENGEQAHPPKALAEFLAHGSSAAVFYFPVLSLEKIEGKAKAPKDCEG